LIWVVFAIWGCSVIFYFRWQWVVEWAIPKLFSGSGWQFQNNPFHKSLSMNNPFRNCLFVDNELRNGLFQNCSLDLDDSSRTTHSVTVLWCHHYTVDALSLLNHCSTADNTHCRWHMPPFKTSTAREHNCNCPPSRTFPFHCFIILRGIKLSLQTWKFKNSFKILF